MKHKRNSEDEDLSTKRFAIGKEYQAVERLGKEHMVLFKKKKKNQITNTTP